MNDLRMPPLWRDHMKLKFRCPGMQVLDASVMGIHILESGASLGRQYPDLDPSQRIEGEYVFPIEPDAVDYVTRGRAYLDLNRYEDAYLYFSQAIQLDPKYAAAHFFRADGLLRQERLEEAVADFTQAIELGSPQEVDFPLADAYLFRGSALMALARLDQAAADFAQAIGHREPTEAADDYRILAECHEAQEKTAAAEYDRQIADLLDAIHKQPADVASLRAAAMLLATCPLPEIRHGSHAVTLAQREDVPGARGVAPGSYTYRVLMVDLATGQTSPASDATNSVAVTAPASPLNIRVVDLVGLPSAPSGYVQQIYRSAAGGGGTYVLVGTIPSG